MRRVPAVCSDLAEHGIDPGSRQADTCQRSDHRLALGFGFEVFDQPRAALLGWHCRQRLDAGSHGAEHGRRIAGHGATGPVHGNAIERCAAGLLTVAQQQAGVLFQHSGHGRSRLHQARSSGHRDGGFAGAIHAADQGDFIQRDLGGFYAAQVFDCQVHAPNPQSSA